MSGAIDDLYREVQEKASRPPEAQGVSVKVVNTLREDLARAVAPLLARELFPGRRWGSVLHIEHLDAESWEVVIQDLGPVILTTRGSAPPSRSRCQ